MAKQTINVGLSANDRTGDPLRTSFQKINSNFTEVYTAIDNIPSNLSDFNNDAGFITANSIPTQTEPEYIELTNRYILGTPVSFTKVVGVDEEDEIDTGLTLARDPTSVPGNGGIYNSAAEEIWNSVTSPVGLLWNWDGWDNLDTVKQRQYVNFRQALKNRIGENVIGAELVAHDTINDKYYTFMFTQWTQGAEHDGIFAYTRRLIDVSNSIGVTFADGSNLVTAPSRFSVYPQTYIGDTSAYTLVLDDAGKHVYAFGVTITIPSRLTVDYPIGSVIKIVAENQPVTLQLAEGVSVSSSTSESNLQGNWVIPANAIATLIKTRQGTAERSDVWRLSVPVSGSSTTSLLYLELTNQLVIVQPAILGTPVNFTRTGSGSQTDPIDTDLTLARGANGALYNAEIEEGYDNITHDSPAGTEWNSDGWGTLLGLHSRTYGNLRSVLNNQIGNNIIGAELIMHDTINDKYYKVNFTDWGQNNGGSFAYTRTLITDPNYFIKPADSDNTDVILADTVGITSANTQGIYNSFTEEAWDQSVSPEGTLWNSDGYNDLTNVESRIYTTFYEAVGEFLSDSIVDEDLVMYIPASEKYYRVKFTQWDETNGEFAYTRSEINVTEPKEGIEFADGSKQTTAYIPTNTISTATGNRRIEEASGYSEVSVTERVSNDYTGLTSQTTNGYELRVARTPELDAIFTPLFDSNLSAFISLSYDNTTYREVFLASIQTTEYWFYYQNDFGQTTPQTEGDTVYLRVITGADPQIWWNKNELPSGSNNFRGAVIDYHAYTGEATWIGTIHIVDDDGDENIAHTEVSSGSTDSENDDLWVVDNEGTIKYRRIDGESKTLKIHWTAKVFYGSETYD